MNDLENIYTIGVHVSTLCLCSYESVLANMYVIHKMEGNMVVAGLLGYNFGSEFGNSVFLSSQLE
jgi:hypothetical protein